jgi:hypothetical protein
MYLDLHHVQHAKPHLSGIVRARHQVDLQGELRSALLHGQHVEVDRRRRPPPPSRYTSIIHVLRLPDLQPTERIGDFWDSPATRSSGELLIDLEEDKAARAVVFGLLAEIERK